jgi:cation:H+ antiporter
MGLIGLYCGAKFIIDGAVGIAKALGVSELIIGATVVAFGTSLPELASSVSAMRLGEGHPGIVIGNVLGSNLANFGLAIGLVAIFHQMHLHRELIYDDAIFVIASGLALFGAMIDLRISAFDGLMMLAMYSAYVYHKIPRYLEEKEKAETQDSLQPLHLLHLAGGIVLIYISSDHLIGSLLGISASLGIGEEVAAFLLLAVGTSLPEVATSIVATKKGQGGLAIGNILGSSSFNNLAILGVSSFLGNLVVIDGFVSHALLAMIFSSLLLGLMALNDRIISRLEGAVLFIIYCLIVANMI